MDSYKKKYRRQEHHQKEADLQHNKRNRPGEYQPSRKDSGKESQYSNPKAMTLLVTFIYRRNFRVTSSNFFSYATVLFLLFFNAGFC